MYTSGSTGRPKGVAVPHRALVNLLLGMAGVVGSRPDDRWLNLTSLSFDISGLEILLPLVTGGRLVIASEVSAQDGRAVNALIREQGVTHVQATPSGWRVLLETGLPPGLVALTGGEALPLDLARELRARVDRLYNVYGPTETTIWSTTDEIPADPQQVTIGSPIANTQLYIVDAQREPVPIGVPGELCIGGHGLADGYLGQPELTRERFISLAGQRVYLTGDLCAWLPDGRVTYLGRSDAQVKVRGHRVELGEIEQRLREHPDVADAAVALRGDQLIGYLVPAAPEDLKSHLAQTLPAAMIPNLFLALERLPLTPNGKLDRVALPSPPPRAAAVAEAAPLDETTAFLKEVWQELLSIDDVGIDEDLFDLGGHSLTITRINGRIFQRYGVEVPLEVFFDTPTIAEIAEHLREAR
jgi:acyl-coenzyme A synthetase/AMP-(fatty) acid ligase/acyl carrier protein